MKLLHDQGPACLDTGRPEIVRRFDDWAASYDLSAWQTALYGPVHAAVVHYARRQVPYPAMILDVGCGTGRLAARLVSVYGQARVVGVDASTGMIQSAAATTVPYRSRFAVAMAEDCPLPMRCST
jgi:ubiquinone/menaquinone biosynthesis C-methylase UbiE